MTARSRPKIFLHAEGFFLLVTSLVLYANLGFSWLTFALLFLVPDVSMLGYLRDKKFGALVYNLVHTTTAPLGVFLSLFALGRPESYWFPLIWIAHIGFDRLMGYGLKYDTAFKDTHLQRV